MKMVILVTGGAGFLGFHLVQSLLRDGHDVVVFDSLWTGARENLEYFRQHPRFRFVICDVRDPLPEVDNVEQIYHLACPASPDHFEVSPIEILETCFRGTQNVMELAKRHRARILIASTSETYGDPTVVPQSESFWGNVNCFGPRSCYDEGKRIAESLAFGYQNRHGVEVRIARIFNSYGPHMRIDDGRAVPNFIVAALESKAIIVHGDGTATRCFQFATDCVRGMVALMNSEYSRPVNIGSNIEVPVGVVAQIIAAMVAQRLGQSTPVPIEYLPKREDDPTRRQPDITVAKREIGWEPEVALKDGLSQTIEWFLKNRTDAKRAQEVPLSDTSNVERLATGVFIPAGAGRCQVGMAVGV